MIFAFLTVAATGTYHTVARRDLGFGVTAQDGKVVVSTVELSTSAAEAGLAVGDELVRVGSTAIQNPSQARGLIEGRLNSQPVPVGIVRNGEPLTFTLVPSRTFSIFFIVLNDLLALTFITVGLTVRWGAKSDSTSRSFFRLVASTGTSILLFSHENLLQPLVLHHLYTYLWLTTYSLIPVTFVIFLMRLTGVRLSRRFDLALYALTGLMIVIMLYLYTIAYGTDDAVRIMRFEKYFRGVFGAVLVSGFIAGFVLILKKYLVSRERSERDRMSWLLIVTGVGLLPFFLLYKLPMVIGGEKLVPIWVVFGIMLIVPVGWGMAVASFKMLNLEWALSRTIIYILAVLLTVYLILTVVIFVGYPLHLFQNVSLPALTGGGALLLVLGSAGLAAPIRKLVDSTYYRDWFNLRDMMKAVGEKLTRVVGETEIEQILTVELPAILSLEKVTLLIGNTESLRTSPLHKNDPRLEGMIADASLKLVRLGKYDLSLPPLPTPAARLASMDYQQLVPLVQGGVLFGALLIGRKISKAPFGVRDHMLLDAITSPAAAALSNIALTRWLLEQEKRALAADMAGGIAHEINNALSPMLGQAQLMEFQLARDEAIPRDALAPALEVIVMMCDRIRRIALNLNQLSQPPRPERELLTLESVAAESIVILNETAGRIKRFSEVDSDAPFRLVRDLSSECQTLFADRQQLGQVFLNLIVNAADALESQGHGTITVGVQPVEPSGATGYVADNGPGIPPELQERIFQPYFTTKPKGKGTGLGLAIIRQIVESHGGWVKCHSTVGVGTRFEFFIPASTA